jgi:Enoyl-CoA hydratase/isomerase
MDADMETLSDLPIDTLDAEAFSPLGNKPLVVLDATDLPANLPPAVLIAVDRAGALPVLDVASFDALVTTRRAAPAPWVSVVPERLDAQLDQVCRMTQSAPIATSVLARVLRIAEQLPFEDALEVESLAYSALLGGAEFSRWRSARSLGETRIEGAIRYERHDDLVTLTLASPDSGNAMTAAMRDALYEALASVLDDPSAPGVVLKAEGRCFSTGGYLPEFGTATDLAQAHAIRTLRSSTKLLHRLGNRAEVHLHGACIGSGIEVPAAAVRRIGTPGTFVQLPELRMGLIPGAGGTASLASAIGRQRLMWLILGAFRLGAETARDWGLLHAIVE